MRDEWLGKMSIECEELLTRTRPNVFDDDVLAEIGNSLIVDDFRYFAIEHAEDFVVRQERRLFAFEVATGSAVSKDDARGLAGS